MSYETTLQADGDIIDIFAQGAEHFGVQHAEDYLRGLIALFQLLAKNPLMARQRSEIQPAVRLHPYKAHMIVYIEHGDGILVIRVLHRRQDWEQLLA